jgi:hypothetical protein
MARAGRKRKQNVKRYPSGCPAHQRRDQIKAGVVAQRLRLGATKANAANPEWESAAGRAYMHKLISRRQYGAAQSYERVIIRYAVANNIPAPFPRSLEFDADLRGGSVNAHDADDIASINAAYQKAYRALQGAGRQASLQVHATIKDSAPPFTETFIIEDEKQKFVLEPNWVGVEWLRGGLDALADHFKIAETRVA